MPRWNKARWLVDASHVTDSEQSQCWGRPPLLWGIICTYHPAAVGSNPKHTNYAFSYLHYWNCNEKRAKRNKKDAGIGSFLTTTVFWTWNTFQYVLRLFREIKSFANWLVRKMIFCPLPVWPELAIYWILGNFLKPLATINWPKSSTFLGNFCKDVKIYHFCSEIIFGQLLKTFGNFFLVTLPVTQKYGAYYQNTHTNWYSPEDVEPAYLLPNKFYCSFFDCTVTYIRGWPN